MFNHLTNFLFQNFISYYYFYVYTVFVPFILRFALLAKTMFIHIAIVGFSIYVNKFIYWLLQLHSKLFIVINMPTLSYISACGLAPSLPLLTRYHSYKPWLDHKRRFYDAVW